MRSMDSQESLDTPTPEVLGSLNDIGSRARDSDRRTRVHLSLYDRSKFLLLFAVTFLILVWASLADNPLLNFKDAVIEESHARKWLLVLAILEFIRQLHFLISEIVAPYHGIWQKYFSFVDSILHKFSDWTRYRLSRVVKVLLLIGLLAVVLGAIYSETPIKALFFAPRALWSSRPLAAQGGGEAFAGTFRSLQAAPSR